jgi:hypothetical protein
MIALDCLLEQGIGWLHMDSIKQRTEVNVDGHAFNTRMSVRLGENTDQATKALQEIRNDMMLLFNAVPVLGPTSKGEVVFATQDPEDMRSMKDFLMSNDWISRDKITLGRSV